VIDSKLRASFPFRPTLRREFDRKSVLRVFAPIFQRALPTETKATVEILDRENRVVFAAWRDRITTSVDLLIGLSDLDPGVKRIRLHVSNGHLGAQKEVGFLIR
jgi:hypothetical protein